MLFHSSGVGCHCSTDVGEDEKVGAEQCRWVPACEKNGSTLFHITIMHGYFPDPAVRVFLNSCPSTKPQSISVYFY